MLITRLAGSPWACAALRYAAIALAILLVLLALRRSGERAGRLSEASEKTNDIQRQMVEVAARRPRDRDGLAGRLRNVGSKPRDVALCLPVVEYSRKFQARAAEELVLLPGRSAVAENDERLRGDAGSGAGLQSRR